MIFPGGLQWHQGLDIAIRAFDKLRRRLPQAEFHIYGDGNMKPDLMNLAEELGLQGRVRFFDPLRIHEIASVMIRYGGGDLVRVLGISGALDTLGSILFKADAGGAREGANPRAVQNELGEGQTLEPSVRSPMRAVTVRPAVVRVGSRP